MVVELNRSRGVFRKLPQDGVNELIDIFATWMRSVMLRILKFLVQNNICYDIISTEKKEGKEK